jgi:drug/metabolite transporter (DMT)-like permease
MSPFAVGNIFLLLSMLCSAGGHLVVKLTMDDARTASAAGATWQQLLTLPRLLRGGSGLSLVALAFVFWLLCLSRLDLSYAYPIASASVLFVTLFSAVFLREVVTARVWLGTVLVIAGVALIGPSR